MGQVREAGGEESCIYITGTTILLVLRETQGCRFAIKGPASTDPELNF